MTKVLVVDDDEGVRESTCEVLQAGGFDTDSAGDGAEALEKIGPDVEAVVLDLFMPKLDGIGMLERLDEHVPVIVVSAFEYRTRAQVEDRCGDRVCAYLAKPVPPTRLLETVAHCVAGAS